MTVENVLHALVVELDDENTLAMGLTGSHARARAAEYSDIDVWRFVAQMPEDRFAAYALRMHGDYLVSLTTSTLQSQFDKLSRPEGALTAVPGLRQMRVLLDKSGELHRLIRAAHDFRWETMQAEADRYASYQLFGFAEEAHKVMNGLAQGDAYLMLYGLMGLVMGMTQAAALHKGVLAESENSYLRQAQLAVGDESEWTRQHKLVLGLQMASPEMRARAGLRLYVETAALLRPILLPEHAAVIEATLKRAARFVA